MYDKRVIHRANVYARTAVMISQGLEMMQMAALGEYSNTLGIMLFMTPTLRCIKLSRSSPGFLAHPAVIMTRRLFAEISYPVLLRISVLE